MRIKVGDVVSFNESDAHKPRIIRGIVLSVTMGMFDIVTKDGHYSKTDREIHPLGKNVFDWIENV